LMTCEIIKRDNIVQICGCQETRWTTVSILKSRASIQDSLPRLPFVRHNPARSQFGLGAGGFL
jgi:hypothetical protein